VYAYTERPAIYSGQEHFAIESFVWPTVVAPLVKNADETIIHIPLREAGDEARSEIAGGLERLGASALLFLRQIEEIRWSVAGGTSGLYLRDANELAPGLRRVTVIGQQEGRSVDEEWLVFSRCLSTDDGTAAGHVELAWLLASCRRGARSGPH
jgi:hypothetical protein